MSEGRIGSRAADHVHWITIDNADKGNCLTLSMLADLRDAWADAERDVEIRCIVLEAIGERHFSTGADVNIFRTEPQMEDAAATVAMSSRQVGITKPVVCVVTGLVVGGALGLVADADIVVASRNAAFADPHIRHGQVCGYGAWRLAERLPIAEVTRLTLADARLSAERAHQLGLIAELYDTTDDARKAGGELAQRIAAHSPTAVLKNLALLHRLARDPLYDEVIAEAQATIRAGWEDEATLAALHGWSHSQDAPLST